MNTSTTPRSKVLKLVVLGLAGSGLLLGAAAGVAQATGVQIPLPDEALDKYHLPLFGTTQELAPSEQDEYDAWAESGYNLWDSLALQDLWNLGDTDEAKARIGQAVLDGEALPFAPGTYTAPESLTVPKGEQAALDELFGAGYTMADVEDLAELWDVDTWDAKITSGEKLLAGEELPVEPSGMPGASN